MKQLYLLLLLCLLRLPDLHAQQTDSLTLKLDAIFANVDKSQVPYRLLADYGLPLLRLTSFNGTLADSTRTNSTIFRTLYASAYTSCIYGSNPLQSLPDYNTQVAAIEASSASIIPVMVQRIDYATLRSDAVSQNLLRIQNNQLYDVPGRSQSPYQTRTLFAAAPSREKATSNTVRLVLPQSLYIQYTGRQLFQLQTKEVDFGDGRGYLVASWDQPLIVSYSSGGLKRIKIRFTYSDGLNRTAYQSQFDLTVPPPVASNPTYRVNNLASLADDSVMFAAAPGQAAGKAYIYYSINHKTNKQLVKPFIVLEGFDQHVVAPHIAEFNYSIDKFLTEIRTSPTSSAFDLRNALENTGDYDIVFVDYARGTDDILLNAGLFEQVLNWVNSHKASSSTEQNVVMGMSMGGLIGRYKLAQLEKANPGSTHVRLLILQDSPQRGANIPLGLSAAVRQANNTFLRKISIKDLNVYLKEAVALLDEPATRQLIKYQTLGPSDSDFFANTFVDGPYRQMIAYTAPYRIVAVSQGSQCGIGLFAPSTELIRGTGGILNGVLGYIIQTYLPIPAFSGQVIISALPGGNQAARIARLYINYQFTIFRIPIRVTLTNQNFTCPAGLLPLDGVAGSTEPSSGGPAVGSGGSAFLSAGNNILGGVFSYEYTYQRRFSFVQPASALDIADFNSSALSASYINNAASYSTSRANSFIAQEQTAMFGNNDYNVPHLTFTARNGEFIFDQMQGLQLASNYCSSECSPAATSTISGPGTLCGTGTYTSPLQGQGYTYSWLASPAGAFTVSSGSGPTFQTANVSSSGQGTISLTVRTGSSQTGCPFSFTKQLFVGAPQYPTSTEFDRSDICYGVAHIRIDNYDSDPSTTYTIRGNRATAINDRDGTFRLKVGGNQTNVSYTITVSNNCGTITSSPTPVDFTCDNGYSYATYPNPSNDAVTVEQKNSAAPQSQNQRAQASTTHSAFSAAHTSSELPTVLPDVASFIPFTVHLYDTYGKLWLEQPALAPTLQLRTAGLPAGSYIIQVLVAGVVVQRVPLGIQH